MLKNILIALLLMISVSVIAETIVTIEDPRNAETYSGIRLIGGWAVSDVGIDRVEFWKNGVFHSVMPYGGSRRDVEKAYPDYPNSLYSGFGMKWAYSLFGEGTHTITVKVYDVNGAVTERTHEFDVNGFDHFVKDGEITPATLTIENVMVDNDRRTLTLEWKQSSQQYEIVDVVTHIVEKDITTFELDINVSDNYDGHIRPNAYHTYRFRSPTRESIDAPDTERYMRFGVVDHGAEVSLNIGLSKVPARTEPGIGEDPSCFSGPGTELSLAIATDDTYTNCIMEFDTEYFFSIENLDDEITGGYRFSFGKGGTY